MEQVSIFGNLYDNPQKAIMLLREFEGMALKLHPDGYYLTYSGGKDSDTNLELCLESGVKFTVHYNITTVDPPECLRHIKYQRKRLEKYGINLFMEPPEKFKDGTQKTMWTLIEKKCIPPTRLIRYCCDHLKERGGKDRICITGVRREEGTARKSRYPLEIVTAKKQDKKLFNDNDKDRMQFENCMQKGKRVINPLIDWKTSDIWDYLKEKNSKYCSLYDEGEERIGCIGCPMGGTKGMEKDFTKYPHYKKLYVNAFKKMLENMDNRNIKHTTWKTGEDVFEWWVYADEKNKQFVMQNQLSLHDLGVSNDDM